MDDYCRLNRHFLHRNLGYFPRLRKIWEADAAPERLTFAADAHGANAAVIFNHAAEERMFHVELNAPEGWRTLADAVTIPPRTEGRLASEATVPASAPGLEILPADMAWDDRELREWAEALIEVKP